MKRKKNIPELLHRILKSIRKKKYHPDTFVANKDKSWHKIALHLEIMDFEKPESDS